ncbi:hypothetical protein MLD38_029461 [Melastoma candidum]|uniref:Uncharacterized protein n=1 Tax=Melastoma candidum TaxID=119954 RepID=A0ACB9N418_9MYRT|nr:hypothetical protein MLD38_029461 [Melastoma candidum]
MSMCDAERRLLANLLLGISNEWFVLLSDPGTASTPYNFTCRDPCKASWDNSTLESGPCEEGGVSLTSTGREVGAGAHPATFGWADITEDFFRKISEEDTCVNNDQPSSPCFLFARKFAPSALEHLVNLTSKVFGF